MAAIDLNESQSFTFPQIESQLLESIELSKIRAIPGESVISETEDIVVFDRCLFWIFASTAAIINPRTWISNLLAIIGYNFETIDFSKWPKSRAQFDKMEQLYLKHYDPTTGLSFVFVLFAFFFDLFLV